MDTQNVGLLQGGEERFRRLSEATFEAVAITENGKIVDINTNFAQMFGYQIHEAIGMNAVEFVIPSYRDLVRQNISSQHEGVYESVLLRKDGTLFAGEVRGRTLCESDRSLRVTVVRDITQRKVAEEARQKIHDEMEQRISERTAELLQSNLRLQQEISEHKQAKVALQAAVDGIITIGERGIIKTFNLAAEKIFGYSAAEVIGKNVKILMPEPDASKHDRYLANYRQTGEKKIIGTGRRVDGRRKDGTIFPIDLAINEMYFDTERLFTGIIRDITRRVQAEKQLLNTKNVLEEKNRLLTAFSDIAQATLSSLDLGSILDNLARPIVSVGIFRSLMIALVDEQTQTVEVIRNYACKQDKLGRPIPGQLVAPRGDVIGLRYSLDEDNITAEVARTGKMQVIKDWDDRYDRRATTSKDVKGTVAFFIPVKRGERVLAVLATGSNFDLEEETRHRIEEMRPLLEQVAIALEHAQLYAKIQASLQEKETLLKELENANQELKDFAYIVSHDLKAPLRGISSLADWISTDYGDELDDKGQKLCSLLIGRAKRMNDLIDGILQYSRLGRIKQEKSSVDLNTFVPEVIDLIAPPENITIEIENELPRLLGDKTHMQQIFQNLLSNAIKYMDKPKGMIKIGSISEGRYWRFSVSDNGPGIEERHFKKIFQLFQILSSRDESESTGVGLSLVKKITERSGGRVWVESKVGAGSTFFFTLPKEEVNEK